MLATKPADRRRSPARPLPAPRPAQAATDSTRAKQVKQQELRLTRLHAGLSIRSSHIAVIGLIIPWSPGLHMAILFAIADRHTAAHPQCLQLASPPAVTAPPFRCFFGVGQATDPL